jgi:hypothetical protein
MMVRRIWSLWRRGIIMPRGDDSCARIPCSWNSAPILIFYNCYPIRSSYSYAYARNNPLKYVDPTGMASALIIGADNFGRKDRNAWRDKAQLKAQELKNQDAARVANGKAAQYSDGIHYVDGSTFDNIQNALNRYEDISLIEFYGHGDGNALYLRAMDGKVESIYSNSWKGELDSYSDHTKDHYVSNLSKGKVTKDVKINLYSCNARTGGIKSVAQSLANHFNSDVNAAGTYTNFTGPGEIKAYVSNKYKWFTYFQTSRQDNGDFRLVHPIRFEAPK